MYTSDTAVGTMISAERGEDVSGQLNLAVASTIRGDTSESKVIAIGNASLIADSAQQSYGQYYLYGMYFFLYSFGWMAEQTDEIIIPPKDYTTNALTGSTSAAGMVGIAVCIVLPLLILCAGLAVYIRRRHL